ncbi:MAG: hypothetical protein ABI680_06645 [Chthoniobacteraceae bacterium]
MAEDLFDDFDDGSSAAPRKDNLFLWTVFILLLIGAAFACWIGSFYVFGHPEQPRSYRILQKLGKISDPRRFESTAAPQGTFLTPQKLFEKYSSFTPLELERENNELFRNYIKNYRETKKVVDYVRGRFLVVEPYELTDKDLFTSGTVALMQAENFPEVLIEHVFPTTGSNVEESKGILIQGYPFIIEKSKDVTAVIHIERIKDGRLLFTVMPLHYPTWGVTVGAGTLATEPPMNLNVESGFPILRNARLDGGLEMLAKLNAAPVPKVPAAEAEEEKGPELVRLDTDFDGIKVPATGPMPEVPVARAEAVRPGPRIQPPGPTPPPRLALNRESPPVARAVPVEPGDSASAPSEDDPPFDAPPPLTIPPPAAPAPPVATPAPLVVGPAPTSQPTSPDGVPLKPFLRSNPQPGALPPETGSSWRTYAAGQLPPGRSVTSADLSTLANHGSLAGRVYLRGNFLVTALGENKVILRPQATGNEGSGIRVIVDYPDGAALPQEGAIVARDAARGFQILDVRREGSGTVNVYVREVVSPR